MKHCDACLFWEELEIPFATGECHRYPRASYLGLLTPDDELTPWPLTKLKDWCGEFREIPEE